MFEELGELFGCEQHMAGRAATPGVGEAILAAMAKSRRYYGTMDHGSFGGGNISGGLSTVEEKSIGAYTKSGTEPIVGLLKPGIAADRTRPLPHGHDPRRPGALGLSQHQRHHRGGRDDRLRRPRRPVLDRLRLGRGLGDRPVIKVCANPETYRKMAGDMDVDAGRIIEGRGTLDEVGAEIVAAVAAVARGEPTKSEALGHQEFVLGYKHFEPLGPGLLSRLRGNGCAEPTSEGDTTWQVHRPAG